jgi:diaminohydroxyphosphoribosylaminopyrimidine deaminase / 5-amino-6-(5-phosphoribosylamino)uracil reductase
VLVGVRTVIADDPQLTVRLVARSSPMCIVLDSTLRLPLDAKVLDEGACTILATTDGSSVERRRELQARGVGIRVVEAEPPWGVDLAGTLALLRAGGVVGCAQSGGGRPKSVFLPPCE